MGEEERQRLDSLAVPAPAQQVLACGQGGRDLDRVHYMYAPRPGDLAKAVETCARAYCFISDSFRISQAVQQQRLAENHVAVRQL